MLYKGLDKYAHLPPIKIKAIELLATKGPDGNMTIQEIADEVGVTRKTLWAWRSDAEFNDAVYAISKEMNRSIIPNILSRLAKDVDTASSRDVVNIARLLLQFHGELTEKSEVTVKDESLDIDNILKDIEAL